jgi:hypothetical protein
MRTEVDEMLRTLSGNLATEPSGAWMVELRALISQLRQAPDADLRRAADLWAAGFGAWMIALEDRAQNKDTWPALIEKAKVLFIAGTDHWLAANQHRAQQLAKQADDRRDLPLLSALAGMAASTRGALRGAPEAADKIAGYAARAEEEAERLRARDV